jgi:hypothetical protein
MAKRAKIRRDMVSPFRDKLWDLFEERASGTVGIDETYSSMKHQTDE